MPQLPFEEAEPVLKLCAPASFLRKPSILDVLLDGKFVDKRQLPGYKGTKGQNLTESSRVENGGRKNKRMEARIEKGLLGSVAPLWVVCLAKRNFLKSWHKKRSLDGTFR